MNENFFVVGGYKVIWKVEKIVVDLLSLRFSYYPFPVRIYVVEAIFVFFGVICGRFSGLVS